MDLMLLSLALCAAMHLALAAWLAGTGSLRGGQGQAPRLLLAAVAATGAWALSALATAVTHGGAPEALPAALDALRHGAWFAFLLSVLRPALGPHAAREARLLTPVAVVLVAAALLASAGRSLDLAGGRPMPTAAAAAALACSVFGLLLLEQLMRNLPEDTRWNAKPLGLGLAVVFAFDLYLHADALLFLRVDADALAIRAAVHALAVPLLFVAARRRTDWIRRLQVSRAAAFHSATLLLCGGFLMFMAAVGYYVRHFGGDWGRALQIAVAAASLAAMGLLVLSGSLRARVKVFVGKHFFSYRFDYREEWLRFTATLSTKTSPQQVGDLVIRGLATMVESPGGTLWMRTGDEPSLHQSARWNRPASSQLEPADSPLVRFLATRGWVIDLGEYRRTPRRYGELQLPGWLVDDEEAWLVVPLLVGDELLGFVTLARSRAPMELDWEVRDLLKTASRQAAGFMAQMHATEALLEARKFEAFNRMSAFVVHDLKNIVTQLSLMMKNAQRLHSNPEFQQDMLLTVESSLEKMRRLMLQLREGATPAGSHHGVALLPILRRLASMAEGRGRSLEIEAPEDLATRGHEERLERVLGHLVHNALDATPPSGRVWARARRRSGQVEVEVGDTGAGMSEAFVQTRLFRPFSSTKKGGMGIGSYESQQYIHELGGSIAVDSEPGRGTVMKVTLPLFEARQPSDLEAGARA